MSIKALLSAGYEFFVGVKYELSKVTWPSRDEFLGHLVVVLIAVSICSVIFSLMDVGFVFLLSKIFS